MVQKVNGRVQINRLCMLEGGGQEALPSGPAAYAQYVDISPQAPVVPGAVGGPVVEVLSHLLHQGGVLHGVYQPE